MAGKKLSPDTPLETLIDVFQNTETERIHPHTAEKMTHDEIDAEYIKRGVEVYALRKEALSCIIQNYSNLNPYERMEITQTIFDGIEPSRTGAKFSSMSRFCLKNPDTPPEFFHIMYTKLVDTVKAKLSVYNSSEWPTKFYIKLFRHPNCATETLVEGFLTEQDRSPIHLSYQQALKECSLQEKFLLDFSLWAVEGIVGNVNCPVEIHEWASTHGEWKIQQALAENTAAPEEYRVMAAIRLMSFNPWDEGQ